MRHRSSASTGRRAAIFITGTGGFLLGARAAQQTVSPIERRAFDLVNGIRHTLYPPTWVVMQSGSLAFVVAAGAAAALLDDRRLAGRLLVGGSSTWAGAKAVKRVVRRGRPGAVFGSCRTLGRPQAGLGYPSGHAAVACSLATIAGPFLPRWWRAAAWAAAAVTSVGRVYVGAHLPLDVVGGAGLGFATGALVTPPRRRAPRR